MDCRLWCGWGRMAQAQRCSLGRVEGDTPGALALTNEGGAMTSETIQQGRGRKLTRLAGLAGVLWPVLAIGRLGLTGELDRPVWDDPVEDIVGFYETSEFSSGFTVGILMVVFAYLFYVVFLAKLAALIRDHERGSAWLAGSMLGLGVLVAAMTVGYLAPFATNVFWASHGGLSADAYLALHGFSFAFYWMVLPTDLVLGIVLGGSILATGLFPRWLGWAMIATAVAEGASFFASVDVWNATSGLPYIWILVAGVMMLRRPDQYTGQVNS